MTDFYPPQFEDERKESPGERAQKWGGYIIMCLRYIDFELPREVAVGLVQACISNFNRWKRKYGTTKS